MNRELRMIRYCNTEKQRTEPIRNLDNGKNEYLSLMNQQWKMEQFEKNKVFLKLIYDSQILIKVLYNTVRKYPRKNENRKR